MMFSLCSANSYTTFKLGASFLCEPSCCMEMLAPSPLICKKNYLTTESYDNEL
jgi:hypothetical protein